MYSVKLSQEELSTRVEFPPSVATAVAITLEQSKDGFRMNISTTAYFNEMMSNFNLLQYKKFQAIIQLFL